MAFPSNKDNSGNNYRIALLGIVTSLYWFSLYAYVPILSPYSQSAGASYRMVGLIIGSYGFIQLLIRIPLGIASDQLRKRKWFVSLGVVLGIVSSLGLWLGSTPPMLLLFRSLAGASAATFVAFTVLFSSYFEARDTPKATGYLMSFTGLGQLTAMLIGGFAAQRFGRDAPFLVAAMGGMIGLLLCTRVQETKTINSPPKFRIGDLLTVIKKHQLLFASGLAIIAQLVTHATIYGFTPIAAKAIGADDFQLGLLTTLATLPVVISSTLSGTFFRRIIGARGTVISGFLILATTSGVIPFISNFYVLLGTQFLGGFGRGMVFPVLMGLSIQSVLDSRRATAMGFFQATYSLGIFLGPVMVGSLSDSVGLNWGFWTVSIFGLVGAFVGRVILKR